MRGGRRSLARDESVMNATSTPWIEWMPRRWSVRLRLVAPAIGIYVASRLVVLALLGSVARVTGRTTLSYLTGWDAHWYLHIAKFGYVTHIPPGSGNRAQSDLGFFPLVPLLVRAGHLITGWEYASVGLVLGAVFGIAAAVVLWVMIRDYYGPDGANRGVALVFFSPAAVVLSMIYSETYIIFFLSLSLLALRRRWWVVAGLAAACATALDPVGIAACLPCAYAAWQEIRQSRNWRALLAPLLSPLGITTFFLYLWRHTGSFLEWFHAQRAGWQRGPLGTGIPYDMGKFLTHFFGDIKPAAKSLGFLVAVVMVWWAWRVRIPGTWMSAVGGVLFIGALSPIIGISPRLLLRGFPLLAHTGATMTRRWFMVVFAISVVAMASLTIMSTSPHWTP